MKTLKTNGNGTKMNIYQQAVLEWGVEAQIDMMIEEAAELIHALSKYKRIRTLKQPFSIEVNTTILEELADVIIMTRQMKYLFGVNLVNDHIQKKLKRLEERLEA